jgi:hypothetical protein
MIIITPTESNNNHLVLKHNIYSQLFYIEPCLKFGMITFIGFTMKS